MQGIVLNDNRPYSAWSAIFIDTVDTADLMLYLKAVQEARAWRDNNRACDAVVPAELTWPLQMFSSPSTAAAVVGGVFTSCITCCKCIINYENTPLKAKLLFPDRTEVKILLANAFLNKYRLQLHLYCCCTSALLAFKELVSWWLI